MKLIRALWGNREDIRLEIPIQPRENEVVYVWGKENLKYLTSLGYDTRFVGDINNFESEWSYKLKLDAIDLAYQEFKEILFLDWDCIQIKDIFGLEFNSPSMPLYSYPKNYTFDNPILKKQISLYSWEFENSYVLPNASYISVQGFNLGQELKKIHKRYKFNTLVEEFSFKVFTDCSLDDYIKNYDSPYLYGRESSQYFWVDGKKVNTAKKLNNYIGNKDIKFVHE